MHPLLAFFPLTESTSESPLSLPATLPRYGEGLDRSPFPILAFTAADLAAPRLVDPFRPRHEDRCGAYRFDDIYHPPCQRWNRSDAAAATYRSTTDQTVEKDISASVHPTTSTAYPGIAPRPLFRPNGMPSVPAALAIGLYAHGIRVGGLGR
jgi:hypothetical protein